MKQSTWDGGEYMLEVKNVSKQYKGEDKLLFDAVSDVSLADFFGNRITQKTAVFGNFTMRAG